MPGLLFPKRPPKLLDKRDARLARERRAVAARQQARQRDHGQCVVCGKPGAEMHHVTYRSRGGEDEARNLITVCKRHHEDIHAKLVQPVATKQGWRFEKGTAV
jgi:5-methylcytosine-specific restriction endonuclease McrA